MKQTQKKFNDLSFFVVVAVILFFDKFPWGFQSEAKAKRGGGGGGGGGGGRIQI